MKTENAKEFIVAALKEKQTVTAQELNYASKGTLPFVQIYNLLKGFVRNGSVQLNTIDGKKSYTLIDPSKFNDVAVEEKENKTEKTKSEKVNTQKPVKKFGRTLTTYKFNGNEYNKGRLAHAVVSQAVKDKKLSLKGALELFRDEIIPPYGFIKPIAEAKKISKEYARFFIKPEEEIKLRDCNIAVSNQWTPDRIEKLLAIAKKLGYKIK